jgi:uncharacterized protein (DUF305 family)
MTLTRNAALIATLLLPLAAAQAGSPGPADAARFEIDFMKMAIDHHFAALRMTELAAGTDTHRDAAIAADEGTAPTPGFAATAAKATLDDLKSMARKDNGAQREEILVLQSYLMDWYGVAHKPRLRPDGVEMIAMLDEARPGAEFNRMFFEQMSRHHFSLMAPVNACLAGTDLAHFDLRRECMGMWHAQMLGIDMMRVELKKHFGVEDYQPFDWPRR